jgi:DNA-binding LytR/AlgR family response regulator
MLVLIIPYTGVLLYLHSTQKGENIVSLLNAGNRLVNIPDGSGELHLAVELDQLILLQSADNYVEIFFMKEGQLRKELVRTSLKKLEVDLDEYPIRRCHRSYMVNINKVSVTMKSKKGLSLELRDFPDELIPVSKNYTPFFTRILKEKETQTA